MAEAYVGEIRLLPYNFTSVGWLPCDGRQCQITNYQALWAVIGFTYGGDGKSYFKVPDLMARVAVCAGNDPEDVFDPPIGYNAGGTNTVTLTNTTIPAHTHTLSAASIGFRQQVADPTNNWLGKPVLVKQPSGSEQTYGFAPPGGTMVSLASNTLSPFPGLGQPHENRQPYLSLAYFICFNGYFPARP
jgi:microcystin-dependent protein